MFVPRALSVNLRFYGQYVLIALSIVQVYNACYGSLNYYHTNHDASDPIVLILPCSLMAYYNPLHQTPVSPSSYTSLQYASKSSHNPNRRRLPQQSYSKPRTTSSSRNPVLQRPVTFSCGGTPGIRMRDLMMGKGAAFLDGANEFVLAGLGPSVRYISLHILVRNLCPPFPFVLSF